MRGTLQLLKGTVWPYKMLLEVAAYTLTTGKSGNGMDSRGLFVAIVLVTNISTAKL